MKRIAIFTEGESDMIFSSYLIKVIFGFKGIKLKYIGWTSDNSYTQNVRAEEIFGNIQIEFTLINVGNDKRVVNKLKENANFMLNSGYNQIFGIRDLGSQEYDKMAGGKIDSTIIKTMVSNTRSVFSKFEHVNLFFAVMELETWYLSLTRCLAKAGYVLDSINKKIGADLTKVDPEEEFYNPKKTIKSFEASFSETKFAHTIGSNLEKSEVETIKNGKRVAHFVEYITALESCKS